MAIYMYFLVFFVLWHAIYNRVYNSIVAVQCAAMFNEILKTKCMLFYGVQEMQLLTYSAMLSATA